MFLRTVKVENFRSLASVEVELGPLNVLVGPNAAGKSNLLEVIGFLGDVARDDLTRALEAHGGLESLLFRGTSPIEGLRVTAKLSAGAYTLGLRAIGDVFIREEELLFENERGRPHRIRAYDTRLSGDAPATMITADAAALATLPRLGDEQVRQMAELFKSSRVFDPNVSEARKPSGAEAGKPQLATDARNLASWLYWLASKHTATFELLVDDLRAIVPGLEGLHFEPIGGATAAVKLQLVERGLRGRTDLAYASFGTVRALALLAMLHDPTPPQLRCVEEIDHGLHPYALDRLIERLRDASKRGQLILATHSPALVNRLRPEELIVCERDPETGASRIPAITQAEVRQLIEGEELGLGELWFSGALGGNP